MTQLPKDPPVVDRELIALMKDLIVSCEFPWDGSCAGPLECCHVRGRGMGGGRRKDTPENMFIACRKHHAEYDGAGQSKSRQKWATENIVKVRPVWLRQTLEEFASRDR